MPTYLTNLMRYGADRHSLVINLGGGVIGDLGGFVPLPICEAFVLYRCQPLC
ncbi:MAG: hypothetical protein IPJ39_19195 [Saprospiraceae bacterium]|nr:hypothetical protein [Saprospiraceae bacterium]